MGSFSFKCTKCGRGIAKNQMTHLFLLKKGKVIQKMFGPYDTYGRVYIKGSVHPKYKHMQESVAWENPFPNRPLSETEAKWKKDGDDHWIWLRVCNLIHSDSINDGIAAIHRNCFKGVEPTIKSVDHPDQGCGVDKEKKDPNYDLKRDHKIVKLRKQYWDLKHELKYADAYVEREKERAKINPSYQPYLEDIYDRQKQFKRVETQLKNMGVELKSWDD